MAPTGIANQILHKFYGGFGGLYLKHSPTGIRLVMTTKKVLGHIVLWTPLVTLCVAGYVYNAKSLVFAMLFALSVFGWIYSIAWLLSDD